MPSSNLPSAAPKSGRLAARQDEKKKGKPKDSNRASRRSLMFALGSEGAELSQCLNKIRSQLILAGVKAGNLPTLNRDRAYFISTFQEAAMRHVRNWYCSNARFENLADPVEACEILSDAEHDANTDLDEQRKLWRSVLAAYVQQSELQAIDEFLQPQHAPQELLEPAAAEPAKFELTAQDAADAKSILDGHPTSLPPDRGGLAIIAGIMSAVTGSLDYYKAAHDCLDAMPSAVASSFLPLIEAVHTLVPNQQRGDTENVRYPFRLSEIELEEKYSFTVLGYRTNTLPSGQFFIRISGIVYKDGVIALSDEESKHIFKDSGDATAFPNTINVGANAAESLSIWRVDHQSPDKKVQFVIKSLVSHVYDVIAVPHSSSHPDLVRDWIKEIYRPVPGIFPVFKLLDGPIVKLPSDTTETANTDFNLPLYGYKNHPTVKWHGRTIVVAPFSVPDFKYDCAPPSTLVKRLFKAKADLATLPVITNRQLTDLAELAAKEWTDDAIRQSIERARGNLADLLSNRDILNEVMEEILKLPSVQLSIQNELERVSKTASTGLETIKRETEQLNNEKKRLNSDIEGLKSAHKKELAAISKEVKLAFERAGAEGIKSLAAISLFKNTLGLDSRPANPIVLEHAADTSGPGRSVSGAIDIPESKGYCISNTTQLLAAVSKWCLCSGLSNHLVRAAISAAAAKGLIAIAGDRSSEVSDALASILGDGITCSVSVNGDMFSFSDLLNATSAAGSPLFPLAMTLGDFIADRQSKGKVSVIRLRGVNRMPPESIFPELLASANRANSMPVIAWTDKGGNARLVRISSPIVFLVDFAFGRSVFPCVEPIAWEIPIIDTNLPWDDYSEPEEEISAPVAFADPSFFSSLASGKIATASKPVAGLPTMVQKDIMKMALAGEHLCTKESQSLLVALAAFARGREEVASLSGRLKLIGGDLAAAFSDCVANVHLPRFFEMSNS